jgi:hypothetical protein
MFKAWIVAGITSAQSLVQDTQKDVNKEGTADHKERNSTSRSARKLNGAHHRVSPLVEIQILHFLLLFLIFFLILYHLNRKHTNFQLNWIEGVAYRNSIIFSMKFKAPSRVWVRCLRSQIWASSREQGWVWFDAKFDSTQFQKKSTSIHVWVTVLDGGIWLRIKIR